MGFLSRVEFCLRTLCPKLEIARFTLFERVKDFEFDEELYGPKFGSDSDEEVENIRTNYIAAVLHVTKSVKRGDLYRPFMDERSTNMHKDKYNKHLEKLEKSTYCKCMKFKNGDSNKIKKGKIYRRKELWEQRWDDEYSRIGWSEWTEVNKR